MSKLEDRYEAAAAEFVAAKAGNDPAAYKRAKAKLRKARAAWRVERDTAFQGNGAVRPAPIQARAKTNG